MAEKPPRSLKGWAPGLAKIFNTTPAAVYERQRALVRAGLIAAGPGRGPGKGVQATPRTIAALLIGMLVTESLTEAVELTERVMHLKNENKPGETFAQALEDILGSPEEAAKVRAISILRAEEEARATIYYARRKISFGASEDAIYEYHRYCAEFSVSIRFGDAAEELKLAKELK
jgi:hypothetical protein